MTKEEEYLETYLPKAKAGLMFRIAKGTDIKDLQVRVNASLKDCQLSGSIDLLRSSPSFIVDLEDPFLPIEGLIFLYLKRHPFETIPYEERQEFERSRENFGATFPELEFANKVVFQEGMLPKDIVDIFYHNEWYQYDLTKQRRDLTKN